MLINYHGFSQSTKVIEAWADRFNGPDSLNDVATAIDVHGNIYVTGTSMGFSSSSDFVTIKYNPDGVKIWVAVFNGLANGIDKSSAIVVDAASNVYVTGASFGTDFDYATIKYDAFGNQLWVSLYNGSANGRDIPKSIGLDNSGNVYVTGFSSEIGTGTDYTTIKYNNNGVQHGFHILMEREMPLTWQPRWRLMAAGIPM